MESICGRPCQAIELGQYTLLPFDHLLRIDHLGRVMDVEDGNMFDIFNDLWKEEGAPLMVKKDQLVDSFMSNKVKNILNYAWE